MAPNHVGSSEEQLTLKPCYPRAGPRASCGWFATRYRSLSILAHRRRGDLDGVVVVCNTNTRCIMSVSHAHPEIHCLGKTLTGAQKEPEVVRFGSRTHLHSCLRTAESVWQRQECGVARALHTPESWLATEAPMPLSLPSPYPCRSSSRRGTAGATEQVTEQKHMEVGHFARDSAQEHDRRKVGCRDKQPLHHHSGRHVSNVSFT